MPSTTRALARTAAVVSSAIAVCCQGQELWSWQSGNDEDDYIRASAVDANGDFVLAGETAGVWGSPESAGGVDLVAVKLDGDTGEELWTWQGGTSLEDSAGVVVVDADGNVMLAGGASDDWESNFAVVKLDGRTGLEMWRSTNGTAGSDLIVAAAVDASGDLVLAGSTLDSVENWLAVKLSGATGAQLWRRQWSNYLESGKASVVTVDADDNPLLVGKQGGRLEAIKLDGGTGVVVWSWQTAADGWDAVTVEGGQADASGDLLLGGTTEGNWYGDSNSGLSDFMALKLDGATGVEVWRWQGGTNEDDKVSAAIVNPSGDLILAGWTLGSWGRVNLQEGEEADFMCVTLDGDTGEEISRWQGGSTTHRDSATTAAADASGHILLAGWTNGDWGTPRTLSDNVEHEPDYVAVKLAASLATPSPQPLQAAFLTPASASSGSSSSVAGDAPAPTADVVGAPTATATPGVTTTLEPAAAQPAEITTPTPTVDVAPPPTTATPVAATLAPAAAQPAPAMTTLTPTIDVGAPTATAQPAATTTPAPTTDVGTPPTTTTAAAATLTPAAAQPAPAMTTIPTPTAPPSSLSVPTATVTPAPTTTTTITTTPPDFIETLPPTLAHSTGLLSPISPTRLPSPAPTEALPSSGATTDGGDTAPSPPSVVDSPSGNGDDDDSGVDAITTSDIDSIGESGVILGAIVIGAVAGCLILAAVVGAGYRRLTTTDVDDDDDGGGYGDDEFSPTKGKANPKVRGRPGALRSKV